jgi:hypothetical protein
MATPAWAGRSWRPVLLSLTLGMNAAAQGLSTASLFGTVRDSSGTPVASAQLTLLGLRSVSDSAGRYLFASLPAGTAKLSVRRLGFEPKDFPLQLESGRADSLHVVLTVLAVELPGVTTEADELRAMRLAHFYRHRKGGSGMYFDRAELDQRRVQRLSDLMRRLPGVRIATDRNGRLILQMGRASSGRDCPPDFWIDGVRAAFMQVDDVPMMDIEALEVYRGPSGLPPEMNSRLGNPGCGTVVIWTRVPGT